MKKFFGTVSVFIICMFLLVCNAVPGFAHSLVSSKILSAPERASIFAKIDQLTNCKGQYFEKEGVYKVGFPRSDLAPDVAGVKLTPAMGLGVWAAFKIEGDQSMVMGDNVLLQDQVNPVLSTALDNDLEVTAIHNHFLWDSPKIMFMHIGGSGDTEKMAAAVGNICQDKGNGGWQR